MVKGDWSGVVKRDGAGVVKGDWSGVVKGDWSGMVGEDPALPGEMERSSTSIGGISGPGGSAMMFRF